METLWDSLSSHFGRTDLPTMVNEESKTKLAQRLTSLPKSEAKDASRELSPLEDMEDLIDKLDGVQLVEGAKPILLSTSDPTDIAAPAAPATFLELAFTEVRTTWLSLIWLLSVKVIKFTHFFTCAYISLIHRERLFKNHRPLRNFLWPTVIYQRSRFQSWKSSRLAVV